MTEFEDNLKKGIHDHDPRNVMEDTIAQRKANEAADARAAEKAKAAEKAAESEGEPDEERRELILQCGNCGLVQSAIGTDFCSNCNNDLRNQDPVPLTGNPAPPAEQEDPAS